MPLVFVFPIGLVFWIAYVWAFGREARLIRGSVVRRPVDRTQDRWSLQVIAFAQLAAIFGAFALAVRWRNAAIVSHRVEWYWIGVAALIAGGLFRRHCFAMLGRQFTPDVRVSGGDPIIEQGAYRLLRHPSYSAALIMFTGIGLALGNWGSLALLLLISAGVYAYRIHVEERALVAIHGDAYRAYAARTRRLVPWIL